MRDSKIEWTTHTFNPWWGCAKVSPGCAHCYAESLSKRYGRATWGVDGTRPVASDTYWKQPLKWNREAAGLAERPRVFCASMADVFENRRDLDEPRKRLWALIAATPNLDWLLLTKRPEQVRDLVCWGWRSTGQWPANVWLGTTCEDQQRANERIPHLLSHPARVRFLSVEPQCGPVDLTSFFHPCYRALFGDLHWVIQGGESGHGARPFDVEWARALRDDCKAAGVAYHLKQLGAHAFDGATENADIPMRLRDSKGGDWTEWPEDLRVRQYPAAPTPPARDGGPA